MSNQINVLDYDPMQKYDKSIEVLDLPGFQGTQSVFNPYVIFSLHSINNGAGGKYDYTKHYDGWRPGEDENLIDIPDQQSMAPGAFSRPSTSSKLSVLANNKISERNDIKHTADSATQYASSVYITPTAANIIKYSQETEKSYGHGPCPYSWADFLYCKHYGKIPNNRLVTLRRYPYPISDNVVVPNDNAVLPVAQAVTWFSEESGNKLSDMLKMTYGVNWKEIEATVQSVDGNETAFGTGVESLSGSNAVGKMGAVLAASRGSAGQDQWSGLADKKQTWAKNAYTSDGPYWNQIYGPVNVVTKSNMRERGLKFEHEITLKFQYDLSSYSGINPKIAMLDLITNFLILTYTNAKFWGGATRYFPNKSFQVGSLGNMTKFYSGDYGGYADSVGDTMSGPLKGLSDSFSKILSGDFSAIKAMVMDGVKSGVKLGLGNMAKKSMPNMLSIRSMLSGEPVGEWHVTVGNPMNPIAVIGNLILMDSTIEFGETLGIDDFPTELTWTVKLKPGRPRDKGDIESLFNSGYGRLSYAPMTTLSSEKNTFGGAKKDAPAGSDEIKLLKTIKDTGSDSVTNIKARVLSQWGSKDYSDSVNLLFMINASKMRF